MRNSFWVLMCKLPFSHFLCNFQQPLRNHWGQSYCQQISLLTMVAPYEIFYQVNMTLQDLLIFYKLGVFCKLLFGNKKKRKKKPIVISGIASKQDWFSQIANLVSSVQQNHAEKFVLYKNKQDNKFFLWWNILHSNYIWTPCHHIFGQMENYTSLFVMPDCGPS